MEIIPLFDNTVIYSPPQDQCHPYLSGGFYGLQSTLVSAKPSPPKKKGIRQIWLTVRLVLVNVYAIVDGTNEIWLLWYEKCTLMTLKCMTDPRYGNPLAVMTDIG